MNIINWIFFITSCVGFLISIGTFLTYISENELDYIDESIIVIGLNFVTLLITGLIFYTTINIFSLSTSKVIFQITLCISILVSIFLLIRIFKDSTDPNWFPKVLTILIISINGFLLFISLDLQIATIKSSVLQGIEINSKYILPIKEIVLVFWIPVFIIMFMYWNYKKKSNNSKIRNEIINKRGFNEKELDYLIDSIYYEIRELDRYPNEDEKHIYSDRMEEKLRRIEIDEEIKYRILRNFRRLLSEDRFKIPPSREELRSILLSENYYNELRTRSNIDNSGYLLEEMSERLQSIIRKEFKKNISNINIEQSNDINKIKTLVQSVNDIKATVESEIQNKVIDSFNRPDYSTQKVFIRELYHYLMTPLSQINAASITLGTLINFNSDNPKITRNINAIKAGVDLCQSVLTAYRQLAFIAYKNNEEDRITLLKGINSAELLYQEYNAKSIKTDHLNIPNSISGYSNNFILSILLPLIENSICASKNENTFSIEFVGEEKFYSFILNNTTEKDINIKNFYKEGYSSKNNHEGTGLSTVRNLIENISGSSLKFEKNNGKIITKLNLPKNDE